MKETREVEIKKSEPIELTTNSSLNISQKPLQTQTQSEILEIKPKIQTNKFETLWKQRN